MSIVPTLIKKYVPRITFHPSHTTFPTTLEKFVQSSSLVVDGVQTLTQPSVDNLRVWSKTYSGDWTKVNLVCSPTLKSDWDANTPAYVSTLINGTTVWIMYTIVYPQIGMRTAIIEFDSGTPVRVWYGRHDGGQWVKWNDVIRTRDDRPVLFVSLKQHDFYPSADDRVWVHTVIPYDYTDMDDSSQILYPVPYLLDVETLLTGVPIVATDIMQYRGQWNGVKSPWTQAWYTNVSLLNNEPVTSYDNDTYAMAWIAVIVVIAVMVMATVYQSEALHGALYAAKDHARRVTGI